MLRTHFVSELDAVRKSLIEMGETTIALLSEALQAILDPHRGPSTHASELEAHTDHLHRVIHDRCLTLITLQAPVASDARLVTGILDAIVDLELIGDYAYEIVTLSGSMERKPPSQVLAQVADCGAKIRESLLLAIESWRTQDRTQALSVRPREASIRTECETLYEKVSQLLSAPGEAGSYVNLMMICKHLERILRHAGSVADQAASAAPLQEQGQKEQGQTWEAAR